MMCGVKVRQEPMGSLTNVSLEMTLGIAACVIVCLMAGFGSAWAVTVSGDVGADNCAAVFSSDRLIAPMTAIQRALKSLPGPSVSTSVGFSTPHPHVIIVTWGNDNTPAQGLLHDLVVDGVPRFSDDPAWEICPTGVDRDICQVAPAPSSIAAMIIDCNNRNAWVAPVIGGMNDGLFLSQWPFVVANIPTTVHWAWHQSGALSCAGPRSPFEPACDHDEVLLLRLACDSTPGRLCPGDTCSIGDDCLSGYCPDGVCCNSCAGQACSVGDDCPSGYCTDGVCCNSACAGPCESCAIGGSEGTCSPHDAGTDPENNCPGTLACTGSGLCEIGPGIPALSEWGSLILFLLLLTSGWVLLRRSSGSRGR